MITIRTSLDLQVLVLKTKREGKTIGFVPTMGALHSGHLSLIEKAKEKTDVVIVSIFVNPTQFDNTADFISYPIQYEKDLDYLDAANVDITFLPSVEEMYSSPASMNFSFNYLDEVMEGALRPGHFNGVALILAKFFNIASPDIAFFGQKDLQQVAVVRTLVRDLSFPIKIETIATHREVTGLAMSSRNTRLTEEHRKYASEIYHSLTAIRDKIKVNEDFKLHIAVEIDHLEAEFGFNVEYLNLVKADNLESVETLVNGDYALCFAGRLGTVRLIDNVTFSL